MRTRWIAAVAAVAGCLLLAGCEITVGGAEDGDTGTEQTNNGDAELGQADDSDADALVITASGTHDCAGRDVRIDLPTGNRADLTGTCGRVQLQGGPGAKAVVAVADSVEVAGSGNKIEVGKVSQITATGSANKVIWGSSSSGSEPAVNNNGVGNVVEQG